MQEAVCALTESSLVGRRFTQDAPAPRAPPPSHADGLHSAALQRLRERLKAAKTHAGGVISCRQLRKLLVELDDVQATCPEDLRLFGPEDVDAALKSFSAREGQWISIQEVEEWVEREACDIAARNFARFREKAPTHVHSIGDLFGNVVHGLLQGCAYMYTTAEDIARTVPIETGYVGVTDFDNELEDRRYLYEQGRLAIRRFAEDLMLGASSDSAPTTTNANVQTADDTTTGTRESVQLPGVVVAGP